MSPEKWPIKSEAPSNISENDKILKKLQEAVWTQNKENLMAELEKPENKDKIWNIVRTMSIDWILWKEFKLNQISVYKNCFFGCSFARFFHCFFRSINMLGLKLQRFKPLASSLHGATFYCASGSECYLLWDLKLF